MRTTTRKSAPKLPFTVPAPVEKALKSASTRFDALSAQAKTAAMKAEKKVKIAARDLQKSGRNLAEKVGGDVQIRVKKATAEAARRAEGVAKNVTERVSSAVEMGLQSLNVPTRKELRSLSAKVDGLGRKIDALKSRKPARATRRAR
jgi:polyhydroxyalkanoate synthesis regulator phasin